jgi:hypothetical protein
MDATSQTIYQRGIMTNPTGDTLIEELDGIKHKDCFLDDPDSKLRNDVLDEAIAIVRQHQAEAVCPYVETDGVSNYCRLAEQNGSAPNIKSDILEASFRIMMTELNGDDGRWGDYIWVDINAPLSDYRKAFKNAIAAIGGRELTTTECAVASPASEQAHAVQGRLPKEDEIERVEAALFKLAHEKPIGERPTVGESARTAIAAMSNQVRASGQEAEQDVADVVAKIIDAKLAHHIRRGIQDANYIPSLDWKEVYRDAAKAAIAAMGDASARKDEDGSSPLLTPPPIHDSDCAMHNEPAYPNGACDCSVSSEIPVVYERIHAAMDEAYRHGWAMGRREAGLNVEPERMKQLSEAQQHACEGAQTPNSNRAGVR